MARKHNEDELLRSLSKKNDVRIYPHHKQIKILSEKVYKKGESIDNPKKRHDLGNNSWGKIDFLINYKGYTKSFVPEFN